MSPTMRFTTHRTRTCSAALAVAFAIILAAVVAALGTGPAAAQSSGELDTYRANGIVAERFDGYVEVRAAGAPADARSLVDEVNAKRRALYKQRAQESGVAVEEVGKLFATKIVESAPEGTYFRQPDGGYVRK